MLLTSFTGQGSMSLPWGMIEVVGSHEGLIPEADIWLTFSLLQNVQKRPDEQNLHFFCHVPLCQFVACRVITLFLPELAQPDVSNFISLLLSFQRIVVKKYSRSESSIQTKSR